MGARDLRHTEARKIRSKLDEAKASGYRSTPVEELLSRRGAALDFRGGGIPERGAFDVSGASSAEFTQVWRALGGGPSLDSRRALNARDGASARPDGRPAARVPTRPRARQRVAARGPQHVQRGPVLWLGANRPCDSVRAPDVDDASGNDACRTRGSPE